MNTAYGNITPVTGAHDGGICKLEIAPIEWLSESVRRYFKTGEAVLPDLIAGKDWLVVTLIQDSYDYNEQEKTSKAGSFFETVISGVTNDIDVTLLQLLETLRFHQFIVRCTDLKKRKRICGDKDAGMIMQINNQNSNTQQGELRVSIGFRMQHQLLNPFLLTKCDGIENFDDVVSILPDVEPPYPSMTLQFSGGNLVGETEVEIYDVEEESATDLKLEQTLDEGEDYIAEDNAYWTGVLSTEYFIVKWRRKCVAGLYTDWQEKTLPNPFF